MNTQIFSDVNVVHKHMFVKGSRVTQADLKLSTQPDWLDPSASRSWVLRLQMRPTMAVWCHSTRDPTQGSRHARQVLYQQSQSPSLSVAYKPAQCSWAAGCQQPGNVEQFANMVERGWGGEGKGEGGKGERRTCRPKWGHFWHIIRNDAYTPNLPRNLFMISIWERAKCSNN